jgi:hypothetical protein
MNRTAISRLAFAEKLVERLREKEKIFLQERNLCKQIIQNLKETKIENSKAIQGLCQKIINLDKPKDLQRNLEIRFEANQITIFENG